jgi:hypothetical protein
MTLGEGQVGGVRGVAVGRLASSSSAISSAATAGPAGVSL